MREIKFRQYLGEGNWHYWGLGIGDSEFISHLMSIDGGEIQEYTGLQDKDGNDIYEGDIIKNTKREGITEIKWQDNGEDFYGWYLYGRPEHWEIIGNIFENKDII